MQSLFSRKSFDFIARVFLSVVFINAIPFKVTNFSYVVEVITEKGIPAFLAPIFLVSAIGLLAIGSGMLIFSRNQRFGALLLIAFLVPATIIFHIWPFQLKAVLMNISLIGGLALSATRKKTFEE